MIARLNSNFLARFVVLLIMTVLPFTASMGQNDSLFGQANKYYQNNEYNLAIKAYHTLIEKGIQTPEVLYNLGNAYYKNGDMAYAILYYEKAKLLLPNDDDINQNLAIANARIVDKIDVIPDFFMKRWVYNLINQMQSNTWAIISMVSFILMLVFILMYFFSTIRILKKIGFYSAVGLLLVVLMTYWCSVKRKNYITGNHTAIVIEPSVTIKSSPDLGGNSVFVLHGGTKVILVDSIENWKEIKLTDGNKGWVESKSVLPI